jgi:dipeptidyl aminopeptidase/acylaminoacyl peptidase
MAGVLTPEVLLSLPRLSELRLSPDGRSLVYVVARRSIEGKKYVSDLHRLDVSDLARAESGDAKVERLTVGEASDRAPRFLHDGTLLFLSARADNDPPQKPDTDEEPTSQIWMLPRAGEPRPLTRRALGIDAFEIAGGTLAFTSYVFPGTSTDAENRAKKKERETTGASALEFDAIPFRFWDRFHGPRHRHLFVSRGEGKAGYEPSFAAEPKDFTPEATFLDLDEQMFDVSPDGRFVVTSAVRQVAGQRVVENLILYDVVTGERRALTDEENSFTFPRFSPDGKRILCLFHRHEPGRTGRVIIAIVDAATGAYALASEPFDPWPMTPVFSPDGSRAYFTADDRGEVPIFCLDLSSGAVRRMTACGGFGDLCLSPDGETIFALMSTWNHPPEIVAMEANATDGKPRRLSRYSDAILSEVSFGAVETVRAVAADGRSVESFLVHPHGREREKLPIVVFVHGGPVGAWSNHWHFRWNPHVFAARGYRVLAVNPRISLGYGQDFVEEGFARWGAEPYTDVMCAFESVCARGDADGAHAAIMGGSFGGYMVNWAVGQTERFLCAVSHAGLWNLPSFHGTTDCGPEWEREFGDPYTNPEAYERWSPHRFISKVRTPTLVVHGEKDYRVPVSEAYMFFTALQRNGVPSKFLYFPDENHWILKPQNSKLWHETIFAWLTKYLGK